MVNFNFNGLTTPILPHIYINKVTLEGSDAALNKIAANKKSVIDMHIQEGDLKLSEGSFSQPKLIVTYDLFLEVEEIYDDFGMFVDDIFKYVDAHVITFKGEKGINAYKHFLAGGGPQPGGTGFSSKMTLGRVIHFPSGGLQKKGEWPTYWGENNTLKKHVEYMYGHKSLGNVVDNSITPNDTDPANMISAQSKKGFIKQKYRHIMPDGRTIYKIPVRIKQEIDGEAFPTNLAAIAVCSLNINSLKGDFMSEADINNVISEYDDSYGRLATEVIIKNGTVPKQGMIFFVSTDQEANKFDSLMGTLWLGGVHKHNDRFMAGNAHDSEIAQPYLDYVMVDNARVHDFRQLAVIKKQILNFESEKNMFFGGNYVDNQLTKTTTADFSDIACFGNLLSSINTNRSIKLSLCIDWGKLIKKNCALPSFLDKLASGGDGGIASLNAFLKYHGAPNILSFKIYRERVDSTNDVINDTGRKLIYDGYPNIYYTGQMGSGVEKVEQNVNTNPDIKSALVPLKIKYSDPVLAHLNHYTFTDYDVNNTSRGIFQYSLEMEMTDPTLSFIVEVYNTIISGVNALKPLVTFVNGGINSLMSNSQKIIGQNGIFDPIKGVFTEQAKMIFVKQNFTTLTVGVDSPVIKALEEVSNLMFFEKNTAIDLAAIKALLDITGAATPDSINVVNEMLISVADRVRSVIESFSTVKIPKLASFGEGGIKEKALSLSQSATIPKRKIKVEYVFDDPTELVNTIYSEAGYDFLGGSSSGGNKVGLENKASYDIGLKSVLARDYSVRSKQEYELYWPATNSVNKKLKLPMLADLDESFYPFIELMPYKTAGRYFTVPAAATYLPKYIVSKGQHNNEDTYWMVVNNILRYKMGLQGDYGADHKLGYGPKDKIGGSLGISAQMERVLKEYQSLAYRGIYFPQDSLVDPSMASDVEVSKKKTKGDGSSNVDMFTWEGEDDPLPSNATLEKAKNSQDSESLIKSMHVPWAQNYGQEKLLLSLINGTFIAPTVLDSKLGAFDPILKGSKFEQFIRNYYNAYGPENLLLWLANKLPHQVLALVANLNVASQTLLDTPLSDGTFTYYKDGGKPQLYEIPEGSPDPFKPGEKLILPEDIQNQDMKIDKFGQFWFNHMNIAEVQYLHGYRSAQEKSFFTTPKYYEQAFNSTVKDPRWEPLNETRLQNLKDDMDKDDASTQWHILCRLVKKKYKFFNTQAYKVLDLPLYDEYFLITTGKQAGFSNQGGTFYNAYINEKPDKDKGAGTAGLQMVISYDNSGLTYASTAEDTEEVEIGTI